MSYCEVEDVAGEFAGVSFTEDDAKVTEDNIESWIEQADAYINSKIAGVYSVPVSDDAEQALLVLKTISILIVSDRVERKLGVQAASQEIDNKGQSVPLIKRADKMLQDIQDEKLILTDATKGSSDDGVSSPAISSSCPPEPVFKKGRQQW